MTKKLICFLALAGLVIGSGALANTDDKTQPGEANLRGKVTQLREKAQEKMQEARIKLEAKRAERVTAFSGRMIRRFEAAIDRLDDIAARISTRLDKIAKDDKNKNRDKDIKTIRTALDGAKVKIELAKTAWSEAKVSLEAVVSSETPKTAFQDAKLKLDVVKTAIKNAHAALVDIIKSMKSFSSSDDNEKKESENDKDDDNNREK